jgi:lipopolysaccharide/colanic/teichoic acid biosynthesis glycosyltransferase
MNNNSTILYVGEDDVVLKSLHNIKLYPVYNVQNVIQALKWLTCNEFNLFNKPIQYQHIKNDIILICEFNLQGIDGIKFFNKLNEYNLLTNNTFILISKKFTDKLRLTALQIGITKCLNKPLSENILKESIFSIKNNKFKSTSSNTTIESTKIELYRTPFIKRLFDITIAAIVLLIFLPVLILVSIAIRIETKGPIIYKSKRVGANFKTFYFLKFRSMYLDADKRIKEVAHLNQYKENFVELECSECAKLPEGTFCSPPYYYDGERICEKLALKRKNAKKAFLKVQNDPRITKVGKFIRDTSIDELPQLLNVIKGDMSIVGNRPLPVNEAIALTKSVWGRRFNAAAGLTGLWQVELRGRGGIMSEEERFMLDNQYAENNSFMKDIMLIFKTIPALMQKGNV